MSLFDTIHDFYPIHHKSWDKFEEADYHLQVITMDGCHRLLKHNNTWYHFYVRGGMNTICETCGDQLVVSLFLHPSAELKKNPVPERIKTIEDYLEKGYHFYSITECDTWKEYNNEEYQKIKNDPDFIYEILCWFSDFDFILRN